MTDLAQQVGGEHRDHGQRQQQGTAEGEHDGQGDRAEQLALQTFQGEQGQEHDDDDADAGGHGHRDFLHRPVDQMQPRQVLADHVGGPGG